MGKLLYFVVAGEEPPREARDVSRLEELTKYPAGLVRIIRKATCRKPEQRYLSADDLLKDLGNYREYKKVGMQHDEVTDRNTGVLSVVPDAPPKPEPKPAREEKTKKKAAKRPRAKVRSAFRLRKLGHGLGLALAFAGVAFLVSDYISAEKALQPLDANVSTGLSSFISSASITKAEPPVLFAQVDESWELLSTERRREEVESLFKAANRQW